MTPKLKNWYLLGFEYYTKGNLKILDKGDNIYSNTRKGRIKIDIISSSNDSIIIGTWFYPNGDYTDQIKFMRRATESWDNYVRYKYTRKYK